MGRALYVEAKPISLPEGFHLEVGSATDAAPR